MTKIIIFIMQIIAMFFNIYLFQIIWNTGVLYFFPVLPMLTYWQAFALFFIKNIFGLYIHFTPSSYKWLKNKSENEIKNEINIIETLTSIVTYIICILVIQIILY